MELTHGLPLTGRGFRPFDPGVGGAPMPDLAAEPEGIMVAMDGDPHSDAAADASG